ncbi:MAG: glycosyltransferase family 2 protein [Leptolyngbya sp. SIOISBB]|nr:glycosyltransferase family 2 protein [Leptolyngbya sp. SIOISBB]
MNSPAVSVVIPAYNAEKTIAETVNSVLTQTFDDFELIIINDGSTDNTLEVIQRFSDARIRVLSYENSGPQKSRNCGLEKAKGKFISFLDADDLWTDDKLELQLQSLNHNPHASVVYSWTNVIDENSNFLRRGGYPTKKGNVFLDSLLANLFENGSNFLAYTDAVNAIDGFDEAIIAGQDYDIAISLAEQYMFEVVPKVQILYRKSNKIESWSSGIQRARMGIDQIYEKHLSNRNDLPDYQNAFLGNFYKYLVYECLNNFPSREKGLYCLGLLRVLLINDPKLIFKKVFLKICLRALLTIVLPSKINQKLFRSALNWLDITSIYGYLQTEILSEN